MNIFMILRIVVGGFFAFSGYQKLMLHYENFLYIVQSYQIFGGWKNLFVQAVQIIAAWTIPWAEFFLGVFLILGLWTHKTLNWLIFLAIIFAVVTAQAILRGLPIVDCGCFGEIFSIPVQVTFWLDIFLLVILVLLKKFLQRTHVFSLDHCYEEE